MTGLRPTAPGLQITTGPMAGQTGYYGPAGPALVGVGAHVTAGQQISIVGYGIVAPEKGWNDYAGIDMRGKTAVILVNDPDYRTEGTEGPFNGRAMTYYGRWTYKYEEAARQGAAAAIIVAIFIGSAIS